MIANAHVLAPEFVPSDLTHRDAELNTLKSALHPVTEGDPVETVILDGPPGTGKTCTAQFILERLSEAVFELNTQYVNCWKDHTRFKTLYRVLEGIDRALDIHRQSTPTDELLDRLHDYNGPPYVVVLDEADQLEDTAVLYDIYRAGGIEMVLIANRQEELFARLDGRLNSRLQTSVRLDFAPYSIDALVAILRDRVRWGLDEDSVTTEQLEWIADAAAGDARVAIGSLRAAARQASQQSIGTISNEHVEEAVPEAKAEIKRKNVGKLTDDQRILYDLISEAGEVGLSRLYEMYEKEAGDPKTKRMVRNYLQKLCHYNLIVARGENRGRTYRLLD